MTNKCRVGDCGNLFDNKIRTRHLGDPIKMKCRVQSNKSWGKGSWLFFKGKITEILSCFLPIAQKDIFIILIMFNIVQEDPVDQELWMQWGRQRPPHRAAPRKADHALLQMTWWLNPRRRVSFKPKQRRNLLLFSAGRGNKTWFNSKLLTTRFKRFTSCFILSKRTL